MERSVALSQSELPDFLLHVAVERPVFVWGQPGIGKSALVEQFAAMLGLECVTLVGTQLAPEDLIGVPRIEGAVTRFYPPAQIARQEPYCLFLDELNSCSHDVQKAFYSLIHDRRLGEYELPEGSVIIAAGNRTEDHAIVRKLSSALINRMVHVGLRVAHRDWMAWAKGANVHPLVLDYIALRPAHLLSKPPAGEQPFSTPRSWHMLSDALHSYGDDATAEIIAALAFGCLTSEHATQFRAYAKHYERRFALAHILKGEISWPRDPGDRDTLHFLAAALREQLIKELPDDERRISGAAKTLRHRALECITSLAEIDAETAQTLLASDSADGGELPAWFLADIVRTVPRLAAAART